MNKRKILKAIFDSMIMFPECKYQTFLNSHMNWDVEGRPKWEGDAYDHEDTRKNLYARGIHMPATPDKTRSRAHMHSRILRGE